MDRTLGSLKWPRQTMNYWCRGPAFQNNVFVDLSPQYPQGLIVRTLISHGESGCFFFLAQKTFVTCFHYLLHRLWCKMILMIFLPTAACQHGCKHGECVGPNKCKCHPGYTGKTCNQGKCRSVYTAFKSISLSILKHQFATALIERPLDVDVTL